MEVRGNRGGPGAAPQRGQEVAPVQRPNPQLQPLLRRGLLSGPNQAGKLLRVQSDGLLRVPLTAALAGENQGPARPLAQLVQPAPGPVEDGLQGVEGGGINALVPPDQAGQLLPGDGAGPLQNQKRQQQTQLLGASANGNPGVLPGEGEAAQHLNVQGGKGHGYTAFLLGLNQLRAPDHRPGVWRPAPECRRRAVSYPPQGPRSGRSAGWQPPVCPRAGPAPGRSGRPRGHFWTGAP